MQLRCYRCGWSFAIKKEEITFAIEALEESGGVHYDIRCPRCRHTNKIALEQLKRSAPRVEEHLEEIEGEEAQEETEKEETQEKSDT
jgi:phage FluMu protein Com